MIEYQKINLLEFLPNQPFKFATKNWVKIKDDSVQRITPIVKTSILKSSVCDDSDEFIHLRETIKFPNTGTAAAENNLRKKVIFKNCSAFTVCIGEICNTQVDNAKNIDEVLPVYNTIEYIDIYLKSSGNWWQYHRDKPALKNAGSITDFPANNNNNNNNNSNNNNLYQL